MIAPSKTTPPAGRGSRSLSKWVLFLSVCLNALLMLHVSARRSDPPALASTKPAPNPVEHVTGTPQPARLGIEANDSDWFGVSTWDLTTLNSRLVQAGCPEHIREAIIETALDEKYRERKWQLFGKLQVNFWERAAVTKTGRQAPRSPEEAQVEAELAQLYKEANARSEALLGRRYDGPGRHWERPNGGDEPHSDFLSEAQRQRLAAQQQEIARLRETLRSQGIPSQQEDTQVNDLKAQHGSEWTQFMSDEEAGEYRARTSRFNYVLQDLYGFEPTPRERQEVIRIYEARDGQVPPMELEAVLGPERAKQFNRARDNSYTQIYRVATALGLGEESMDRVYQLKQEVEAQAQSIRNTPGLGASKRAELLRALRQGTLTTLDNQFGTTGRDLYLKNGGWWVKQLASETR